jgi:hypothetical protein
MVVGIMVIYCGFSKTIKYDFYEIMMDHHNFSVSIMISNIDLKGREKKYSY